jgi:hypothetical protein
MEKDISFYMSCLMITSSPNVQNGISYKSIQNLANYFNLTIEEKEVIYHDNYTGKVLTVIEDNTKYIFVQRGYTDIYTMNY